MQIVIDIDDEVYNEIKNKGQGKWYCREMDNAIRQGIPLPEHHGNLKDEINIIKSLFDYHKGIKTIGQCIESVPTIILATKEGDRK